MKKYRSKFHKNIKKRIIISIILILSLFIGSGLFLLYGPYPNFREWLITTAMSTMNHQYLATLFYSDETIEEVLKKHSIIEPEEDTDTSLIKDDSNNYIDEYDKEILDRDKDDLYKLIKIKEKSYEAYLVAIYDSSKIRLVYSKYLGSSGEYLVDMAKRENAILAINGGGFIDINGQSNGGQPLGTVIADSKIISDYGNSNYGGGIIGFTNDDKLFLGRLTAQEALDMGIRDAVEFGPFLIVNGVSSFINGNGGYGVHPRTAIGQRKDGIVLFLVVDGRRLGVMGADMNDLTEIMLRYHAYNAANLDGGNSSVLVIDNKIVNHPINWDNLEATRPISNGFILEK